MEIPEGSRDPFDIPEGSLEDEDMEGEEENPFHDAEHAGHLNQGGLEARLVHALELNVGELKLKMLISSERCMQKIIWIGKLVSRTILSGKPWPRRGKCCL